MTDDDRSELWIPVQFKGQRVYARAAADGRPLVQGGLVEIRYKADAPKVYRGSAKNLGPVDPGAEPVRMAPAEPAAPKAAAKGASSRGTLAKKGATPTVDPPRDGAAVAYTDGACSGNPGPAGYGLVLDVDGRRVEIGVYLGRATNNIAELGAIKHALEELAGWRGPIDVYTDSNYAIGVLTKAWKPKANQDLIASIKGLLPRGRNVRFVWVPGHAGVPLNERADELARGAIEMRAGSRTEGTPDP